MAGQRNKWQRAGVVLFLLFPVINIAQTNFVLNPSFEQGTCGSFGDSCGISQVTSWVSPSGGTPDKLNNCDSAGGLGMPYNFAGYQYARTGVSYAGIGTVKSSKNPYREYIEGQFSQSLINGEKYCVSFYVSFADSVPYAISAIGAYISGSEVCEPWSYSSPLAYTPQIENPLAHLLIDSLGWEAISGEYIAKGGEQYITIGNFYSDIFSDYTYVRKGSATWNFTNSSYYYLDDVSLREIYTAHASNTFKDTLICAGRYVTIGGDTIVPGLSYHWLPTTGLANPNSPQTTAAPLTTTTYTLTVVNDSMKGCNCPDSVSRDSVTVRVDNFNGTACCSTTITQGQTVVLNSTPASTYLWQPDSRLNCDTCQSVIASPDSTTTYTVVMTDSNGCNANNALTITVKPKPPETNCGELFVPDAFSPNGDGQNDVFYTHAGCVSTFHLIIYDRWGEKVFETESINEGWDGKYHGQPENAGTYVYFLQGTYTNGNSFSKKGNIALVR